MVEHIYFLLGQQLISRHFVPDIPILEGQTGKKQGVFFLLLKLGAQPPVNWLRVVLG